MAEAFWDASAIVPLCVSQSSTLVAVHLFKAYEMAVWWGTPVEIAAALSRLLKVGDIGIQDWRRANSLARRTAENWTVIEPSEALLQHAIALVELYDLRASDALQLAAALEWCESEPHGEAFVTFDKRLRDAALMCGFSVKPQ